MLAVASKFLKCVGTIVSVLALSACLGPTATSSGNSKANDTNADGHYTGLGAYVNAISFDVSNGGATVTHFHGFITASCYTGGSLYSGANQTVYNQNQMDDPESVDVTDNNSFSTTYTVPGTKGGFSFNGSLDGKGGATGFVTYKSGACASGNDPWSASLTGVPRPALPSAAPSPAAGADCGQQPCGVIAGFQINVNGFNTATWSGASGTYLDLDVTMTNSTAGGIEFADHLYLFDADGRGPIGPGMGINSLTLADGTTVDCSHGESLSPGESQSYHFCYAAGDLDLTGSIKLNWNSIRGSDVNMDLGTPS